jgi:hypothetical protein
MAPPPQIDQEESGTKTVDDSFIYDWTFLDLKTVAVWATKRDLQIEIQSKWQLSQGCD